MLLPTLLLSIMLAVGPSGGPELSNEQARAAFDRAMVAYQAEDYATASEELAQAYQLEPAPELLYARAQMVRYQGDCELAIELYRAYLATNPDKREDAEENLARCQALLAVRAQAGHEDSAEQDAKSEGNAESEPDRPSELSPALSPDPTGDPPVSEERPPQRWRPDTLTIALGSTGLLAAAIGGTLTPVGIRRATQADEAQLHQDYDDRYRSATGLRNAGLALLVTGGALLVSATIRAAVVSRRRRASPGATQAFRRHRSR